MDGHESKMDDVFLQRYLLLRLDKSDRDIDILYGKVTKLGVAIIFVAIACILMAKSGNGE